MAETKDIKYGDDALRELLIGVDTAYSVVASTLGTSYKQTLLQQSFGSPKTSDHGHLILKELELPDPFQNMGCSLLRQLAEKMHEDCGDGTTTAVILVSAIVKEGLRLITSGENPILLKRSIDHAVDLVVRELEGKKITVDSDTQLYDIALAAASGNEEMADLISRAVKAVGNDGVVTVEAGKNIESSVSVQEGLRFDKGYLSAYFVTDTEKSLVEMSDCKILITDKKISSIQELLPALQSIAASGTSLCIIAEDFESEVLSTLIVNKIRGTLKVVATKAPGFGDQRKAMLEDIALLTGGTVVSEELGMSLENTPEEHFGSAHRLSMSKTHTTIIGGQGKKQALKQRVQQIDAQIAEAKNKYDKERLRERKGKLQAGVGVISVGAATETALGEKQRRIEGALNATLSAIAEGVFPGSGAAYLHAAQILNEKDKTALGQSILFRALSSVLRQLLDNAGEQDPTFVIEQVLKAGWPFGYNAKNKKVEDLFEAGVLDPAKSVIHALLAAASTAGVILTTDAAIVKNIDED